MRFRSNQPQTLSKSIHFSPYRTDISDEFDKKFPADVANNADI